MSTTVTAKSDSSGKYLILDGSRIYKLTGAINYLDWHEKFTFALEHMELLGVIQGKRDSPKMPQAPPGMPDAYEPDLDIDEDGNPVPPPVDPWLEHRKVYNAALEDYITKEKDHKKHLTDCFYYLKNAVSEDIRRKMSEKKDAIEAFEWLTTKYSSIGLMVLLRRRAEFYNLRWDGTSSIEGYFANLDNVAAPLRKIHQDFRLNPIDILQKTIEMPERYEHVVETLCTNSDITGGVTEDLVDVFQTRLRDVYLKEKTNPGNNDRVLATTTANSQKNGNQQPTQQSGNKPYLHIGRWDGPACEHCYRPHPSLSCFHKYPHIYAEHLRRQAANITNGLGTNGH